MSGAAFRAMVTTPIFRVLEVVRLHLSFYQRSTNTRVGTSTYRHFRVDAAVLPYNFVETVQNAAQNFVVDQLCVKKCGANLS